jgi:hypothetical protein
MLYNKEILYSVSSRLPIFLYASHIAEIDLDEGFLGKCRRLDRFSFPVAFYSMDTVMKTHFLKEQQSEHEADHSYSSSTETKNARS